MNRPLVAALAALLVLIAAAPAAAQSGTPGAGNELDWGFRETFRTYVHAGDGTPPIAASNGAICDPNPNAAKGGCDPAGEFKWRPIGANTDLLGNGTVAGQGVLAFSYPAHKFALKLEDPWLIVSGRTLGGGGTVTLRAGLKLKSTQPGSPSSTVRVDVGTFPVTQYTPGMSSNTWATGAGTLTQEASDAMGGGFLQPGAELDAMTFSVPTSIGAPPASEPVPVADPDPVPQDPGPQDPGPQDPGPQQPAPQQPAPTPPANNGGGTGTTPPPPVTSTNFGGASITPRSAALKALKKAGIKVSAGRPAKVTSKRWTLPVVGGSVGSSARLDHGGSLKLTTKIRRKKRTVTLTKLRATLGKKSTISATISRKQQTVFAVTTNSKKMVLSSAAPSAALSGGKVAFTKRSAKVIAKKLGLKKLPVSALGTLAVMAKLQGAPPATSTPGGGSPATPPTDGPVSQPITDEPPVLTRPAGAVDVAGATVTWHVRESWIRYIAAGEGTTASAGATPHPARKGEGTDVPLVYEFDYGFGSGWYDGSTGNAALYTGGTVNFSYKDHGIDLDTKNAEIELNGGASRVIMRFAGRGNTDPGNKRAVLVDLHLDQAKSRTVSPDGKTITYAEIPGTIPQGGSASVFAGFYMPGDPFGAFTVTVRLA